MGAKGFLKEIKRVTITDSQENQEEEQKVLANITHQKIAAKESAKPEVATPFVKDAMPELPPAFQPSVDENKLNEMIKNAISSATSAIAAQKDEELKSQKQQIETQFESEKTKLKTELENTRQYLQQSQQQLKESQETISKFEGVFKLTGSANPVKEKNVNFNTHITSDRDKLFGSLKEAFDIYERAPKVRKITKQGVSFIDFDKRELNRYVRNNIVPLTRDFTEWGRKRGWFTGGSVTPVTEAATTITDLPGGFLPTLSAMMRETHRPGYIFWQFALTAFNFSRGLGNTIQVPRFNYLSSSLTTNDYLLSGGGVFSPIVATSDNLTSSVVDVVLNEWGRGKQGTTLSPVSIPSFVEFYSAYDLLSQLDQKLGFDYATFEDRKIREYYNATSRILYNARGRVTATATDVNAGDNGTMTRSFLINLFAYLQISQIAPLTNGNYCLVLNPTALAQLKADFEDKWEAPSNAALVELTNILNPTTITPEDTGKISGYQGPYYGFEIFSSNAFATGAVGTEGVQNTTIGTGAAVTRTSYAFGRDAVGRGVGMPMELRMDSVTNFDRESRVTWLSHEGFAALDVDPVAFANPSQQLRVVKLHTLDVAA